MRVLRRAVVWSSLALLALLILTPLAQIVMRGVFGHPFSGAEEMARVFLIALTFVAAAWVSREGGQVRMEEFQAMLPPLQRWWLQLAIEAAAVCTFATLFAATVATIMRNLDNRTSTLEIPFWLLFAPLLAGSLLLTIEHLVLLRRLARDHRPASKQTTLT